MFRLKIKLKQAELLNMIAMSCANKSKEILEELEEEIKKWKY